MIRMEQSRVINRPVEEVFAFVADIEKIPQWAQEVVEVKEISEGPMSVGTTWVGVVQLLGRRMENTHELTEYEPNSKVGFKVSGPVSGRAELAFESVEGGTKVTIVTEIETRGFFKLADPIVARVTKRQWETNLATLKDLLEAQAEGSA